MTSRFLAVPLAIIAACGVACVSIHVATTASAPVAASPDIVDATTAPHRLGAFGDPVATTWSYLAGDGGGNGSSDVAVLRLQLSELAQQPVDARIGEGASDAPAFAFDRVAELGGALA